MVARRPGPGPGHRSRRLDAGQHRLVPAPAAARSPTSSTSSWPPVGAAARSPEGHRRRGRRPAGLDVHPGARASTTCSSSRTRTPTDQDIVYYVGPNVLGLEKRFAFPPREFRLWLALHEVTHRAQFTGVPWMRGHFLGAGRAEPSTRSTPTRSASLGALNGDRPGRVAPGQPARRRRAGGAAGHPRAARGPRPHRRAHEPAGGPRRRHHGPGRRRAHPVGRALRAGAARPAPERVRAGAPAPEAHRPRGQAGPVRGRASASSPRSRPSGGTDLLDRAWVGPEMLPTLIEIREPEPVDRPGPALAPDPGLLAAARSGARCRRRPRLRGPAPRPLPLPRAGHTGRPGGVGRRRLAGPAGPGLGGRPRGHRCARRPRAAPRLGRRGRPRAPGRRAARRGLRRRHRPRRARTQPGGPCPGHPPGRPAGRRAHRPHRRRPGRDRPAQPDAGRGPGRPGRDGARGPPPPGAAAGRHPGGLRPCRPGAARGPEQRRPGLPPQPDAPPGPAPPGRRRPSGTWPACWPARPSCCATTPTLLAELAAAIDPTDARALAAAPPALARRAVRRWLTLDHPPDAASVERVLAVARGEGRATEVVGGRRVVRRARRLCLEPQPNQ